MFDMVGFAPLGAPAPIETVERVREEEPMAEAIERLGPSARVATLMEQSHGDLSDAAEQLAALVAAATAELLEVICAIDGKESWRDDGATSTTAWVVAMLSCFWHTTAREWVRVGRSLDALPQVRQAYSEGMLSWNEVRHATVFVTPAEDEEAARELPGFTAASWRNGPSSTACRTPRDAEGSKLDRTFTWRRDRYSDGWRYQGVPHRRGGQPPQRRSRATGPAHRQGPYPPHRLRSAVCLTGRLSPTSIRMHRVCRRSREEGTVEEFYSAA